MVLRESPPSYRISLKDTSLKLYLKKKGVSQDQVFTFLETTYGIQLTVRTKRTQVLNPAKAFIGHKFNPFSNLIRVGIALMFNSIESHFVWSS